MCLCICDNLHSNGECESQGGPMRSSFSNKQHILGCFITSNWQAPSPIPKLPNLGTGVWAVPIMHYIAVCTLQPTPPITFKIEVKKCFYYKKSLRMTPFDHSVNQIDQVDSDIKDMRYFQHWHFCPNSSTPSKSILLCQEQFTLSKSTFTLSE